MQVISPPGQEMDQTPSRIILRDGTIAVVRATVREDLPALRRFFHELSPESHRRRFFSFVDPMETLLDSFCDSTDPSRQTTLVALRQVEGELREGLTAMDALRASFPAGTMTGAPKVRAMEIIDELEPQRRAAYAGAIGYIAAGAQRMDLAITIRTCVMANGVASVQAGAGIVHDSVPEREWDETENKARALLTAIGRIRRTPDGAPREPDNAREAARGAASRVSTSV